MHDWLKIFCNLSKFGEFCPFVVIDPPKVTQAEQPNKIQLSDINFNGRKLSENLQIGHKISQKLRCRKKVGQHYT